MADQGSGVEITVPEGEMSVVSWVVAAWIAFIVALTVYLTAWSIAKWVVGRRG